MDMASTLAGVLQRNSIARELREIPPSERQTWLAENAVLAIGGCALCGSPLGEEAIREHLCCICLDGGRIRTGGGVEICTCRTTGIPEQEFLKRSGIPATMAGYQLEGNGFKPLADEFLATWPPEKCLLLLTGPVGTGKSGFSVGILRELWLRHHKVGRFIKARDLMERFYASFEQDRKPEDDRYSETTADIQRELSVAPLIVLDDLGTENRTDFAYTQILGLIDQRTSNGRPLIVTTNLDVQSMDARVKSRLQDTERGKWAQFRGADRRVQK